MRLFVGICSARDAKAGFIASLLGLWSSLLSRGVGGKPLEALHLKHRDNCSILSNGRQRNVAEALKLEATHILFLDDDMTFPADTVDRLAGHGKPIVAVNYRAKVPGKLKPWGLRMDGSVAESAGHAGLEEVGRFALGIVLAQTAVFRQVPAPHFEVAWDERANAYRSDDYALCDKLREAGVPMFVDHDLSLQCGHIGDLVYRLDGKE